MSEKKKESKLSLSAKADKFDVPLSTLKKVYKRGVAAWNSGHRPGTTPQQWGHARVNSFLRKGKTYHTADKDLREDAEQLNELKKETLQSYLEKRRAPKFSDIARAETVGKPEERQKDIERANLTRISRARAKRKLQQIDRAENPQELVQQHHDIHHPYASRVPGVPDKPGSVYWGDHVEHEDVNQLFERLLFLDADPEQASAASALEKSGKSPEQIWKEKGAFRDPYTGKWTKEISDKQMDLPHFEPQSGLVKSDKKAYPILAQGAIKHDELFKQVPGVKATQVTTQSITPVERVFSNFPYRGQYSGADLRRGYRPPSIHTITTTKQGALDVMAHELQHNVDDLQNRLNPSKYDFSQNKLSMLSRHSVDPNEVRANATMSRRELDDKQRRERFPLKDYKLGASLFGGKVGVPLTMVPKSLREMQLVGTDEYRQHAIAMTPGQDQEIEDVFPPEEYGTQVYEPASQEEPANAESDGSVESGVDSTSGNSFRTIRKKLKEQQAEEYEEIEAEEEEELEDDGAEDGIDFTPTLKTKKLRNTGPFDAAKVDNSGLPVLSTSMFSEGNDVSVNESRQQQRNTVRPAQRPVAPAKPKTSLLSRITRGAGRAGAALTIAGAADKARSGDLRGAATDVGIEAGTNLLAKKAGKTIAKRIPLVGAGIGIASAVKRAKAGDLIGAAGEAASGVASTLPGAGTAVSTGIDAALMARDIAKKQKPNLAEAIEYHKENNISLVENIYRPGSEMFFEMIFEAKRQFAEGSYTPKDEYEQDLLESDIGEVAEYNGTPVLLDFPYEEIDEELDEACWDGYEQKGMKKKGKKMVPNCVPVSEENDPTRGKGIGKPFRSRGGGAVYVRNEKGNIIKVNFSQSGMKKRFNEPARVKSFVARHNCYGNKDRTSASYWACRWPRYFSDSGQQWW